MIRSAPLLLCPLCGSQGRVRLAGLTDTIFNVPGQWSVRSCGNAGCGSVWLDPKPFDGEIGKLYANYYTHADAPAPGRGRSAAVRAIGRFYARLKRGYWDRAFGYRHAGLPALYRHLSLLFFLAPGKRLWLDLDVRGLPASPAGALLDIGCGNGQWLEFMRSLGWDARGIDFDSSAVALCLKKGLPVTAGDLHEQHFPAERFDAITLSHVIEHLPHPEATLRECHRILKPGGRIVVTTPNAESFGFAVFKGNWRGLEPPRHLQVFSAAALRGVLERAGFTVARCASHRGRHILYASTQLRRGMPCAGLAPALPRLSAGLVWLLSIVEAAYLLLNPSKGELLFASASK